MWSGIGALSFVVLMVGLLIYRARHIRRRGQALDELLPGLGVQEVEAPSLHDTLDLLPDLLFHPGGFSETPRSWGNWELMRSAILRAWNAELAGVPVSILDVSIDRRRVDGPRSSTAEKQINRTLIRCAPPADVPPDFLLREQPLLKSQLRGQRAINGPEQIGRHYFLFSDAEDSELEPFITDHLREVLTRHRLWTVAAHDGVLFLTRGSAPESPARFQNFLNEGEAILYAFLTD